MNYSEITLCKTHDNIEVDKSRWYMSSNNAFTRYKMIRNITIMIIREFHAVVRQLSTIGRRTGSNSDHHHNQFVSIGYGCKYKAVDLMYIVDERFSRKTPKYI